MARKQTVQYLATLALAVSLPVFTFAGNGHGNKPQPTPAPVTSTTSEMSSTVIDNGGFPNATGLDVLGQPCTAYFAGKELRFAVFDGTGWVMRSVGFVGGDYGASSMDMVVDAVGRPTIVFSVPWEGGVNNDHLYVASFDGTAWKVDSIGLFSAGPSMAIDANGTKYILYVASGAGGSVLKLAESIGATWAISTVDDSNVASGTRYVTGPSIAVDGLGNVAAVYGHYILGVSKQVRYAYRSGGAWQVKSIFSDIAAFSQVAFDGANKPIVAFWAANGGLRMMYSDGAGNWSNNLLPWSGGTASQLSLGLDAAGVVYMTAFDTGAGDLHLISGRPGSYVKQLVASTGTVGKSNSLVINRSSGRKGLSFSDETIRVLKFVGF